MKTFKTLIGFAASIGFLAVSSNSGFGQIPIFTFDENGHGNLNGQAVPFTVTVEPISQLPALTYSLGFATTPGDVVLQEQGGQPGAPLVISDIVRFSAQGNIYFFSDSDGPPIDLADVPVLPAIIAPFVVIPEVGPEGNNGAVWTPAAGQPGSLPTGAPITYNIISDVPEPGPMLLAGLGGVLLLFLRSRRQARRS